MPVTDPNAKPYDFVPLHDEGKQTNEISGHDLWRGLTGRLTCTLKALTPLHVASGMIVPVAELCGHADISWPTDFREPLILEHYRSSGRRVIPATSLKGSIRSVVEAISRSCVAVSRAREGDRETPFNKSKPCRVGNKDRDQHRRRRPARLCPACNLFGAMGFEGKVRFYDAPQVEGNGLIAFRPAPNTPNKNFSKEHRIHRDQYQRRADNGDWHIKGRKFYRHFGPPENQYEKYEPIEVCAADSTFPFEVEFESLAEAELGVLLTAVGLGDGIVAFKLGGSKPFGYGAVQITECKGMVWDRDNRQARCLTFDEDQITPSNWEEISARALAQAGRLILAEQLERLKKIFDIQAAQREHAEHLPLWRRGQEVYRNEG